MLPPAPTPQTASVVGEGPLHDVTHVFLPAGDRAEFQQPDQFRVAFLLPGMTWLTMIGQQAAMAS